MQYQVFQNEKLTSEMVRTLTFVRWKGAFFMFFSLGFYFTEVLPCKHVVCESAPEESMKSEILT